MCYHPHHLMIYAAQSGKLVEEDLLAASISERVCEALERARQIAEKVIAPRATESDRADSPPVGNIRALAEAGLMGFSAPERFGGIGAPAKALREFTETLASSCGVTCFVQG